MVEQSYRYVEIFFFSLLENQDRHVKQEPTVDPKSIDNTILRVIIHMQLSPQKEQEIASKILERAELAQMTRQLKLGLSKVATPKKNNAKVGISPRKNRVSPVRMRRLTVNEQSRISPLKKDRGLVQDDENASPQSPLKKHKRPSTPPGEPRTSKERNNTEKDEAMFVQAVPTTPRNSSREEDVGADLLMYLAASPYTSTKNAAHQSPSNLMQQTPLNLQQGKIPVTPSYMPQHNNEAMRYSHMKSQASLQSTFKVPGMLPASSGAHSQHQQSVSHLSSGFSELVDSPSVPLYLSPPSHRRKASNGTNHINVPSSSSALHVPSTPSRELRSSHLLKTPSFNMGDYVHNLFSPSPRILGSSHEAKDRE